jgi:nitrite reductase (NADH) large subunit
MKVLILGNGIAGISVAKELRSRAENLEISVLARESYDYYSRIRLPEVFGGGPLAAELLALYKPSWYTERRIEVSHAIEVVSIERGAHRVMLSTGEELGYDVLVLAVGSDPVRPAVPGAYLPGVLTVREYDDAARVRASVLAHPGAAAVVGGGLLGLEAARHLRLLGAASVTVLESAPRLLPRQLDSAGAKLLERVFGGMGVTVVTGARLTAFKGRDRLEQLAFDIGAAARSLDASTAVVSIGVRPRLGLAKAAGLVTARGIIVDRFLRTSDPSVYAVGDCAEFCGAVPGIIPAALEQAPCCAAAILGDQAMPYEGTMPSNTLKVAGIDLFSGGIVDYAEDDAVEALRLEPGEDRYERYLLKGGLLAGAIVIGSKPRARLVHERLGKPMTRPELEALLSGK